MVAEIGQKSQANRARIYFVGEDDIKIIKDLREKLGLSHLGLEGSAQVISYAVRLYDSINEKYNQGYRLAFIREMPGGSLEIEKINDLEIGLLDGRDT